MNPVSNPGHQLQQARLAATLTVEGVARSLQLSPSRVVAIEADDYDRLPGPTYVRGYLRAYAQLVGLSPEKLIDDFNRLPAANRRQDFIPPAPPAQATSNESLTQLGTLAVVGIVIGLAVVWWQGADEPTAPTSISLPPPTQTATIDDPQTGAPAEAAPNISAPTDTATPPPAAPRPPIVTTPAPVKVDPNAPRARLVFYVAEDSWTEVRDAYQQRLIYETVAAGRVVTLEGVVPLQVFLGNADGVRVELNGRAYDILRHRRGQVARFTVGGALPPP